MEDLIYEVQVTVRARHGKAVTNNLFPPGMQMSTPDLYQALLALKFSALDDPNIATIGEDGLWELAEKVESDIVSGKYKWKVDIGKRR
jgi:hypothetical protein